MQLTSQFLILPASIKNKESRKQMTEQTEQALTTETTTVEVKAEERQQRNGRGEIGPPSMKSIFRSFRRRDGRKAKRISMKQFCHQLAETGTDEEKIIALDWFKNKAENKRHRR